MSKFFRWFAAIVLIVVSLFMTGTGTHTAAAGSDDVTRIYALVLAACAINFFGVFLGAEMFRALKRKEYGRGAIATLLVLIILGFAANQDQIALRAIFFAGDDAEAATVASRDLQERRISSAEARVEAAKSAIPALERQVEVTTTTFETESQTGCGPRCKQAQTAMGEANAALRAARDDLAAAEQALREILSGASVERRDDAALAANIGSSQRLLMVWAGSLLIETLGILGASLLRLNVGAEEDDEEVDPNRPVTTGDLAALVQQLQNQHNQPPQLPMPTIAPPAAPPSTPAEIRAAAAPRHGGSFDSRGAPIGEADQAPPAIAAPRVSRAAASAASEAAADAAERRKLVQAATRHEIRKPPPRRIVLPNGKA